MAQKPAFKKARQTRERNLRNRKVSKAFKTAVKKLELAINEKKNKEELSALLKKVISLIDKAASKNVIHKNTAGRKKSLISKRINNYLSGKSKKQ